MEPQALDSARVQSHMSESHSYFADLEREWARLLDQHENKWVAAYKNQFVFGDTVSDALAAADLAHWPLDVVAVDRLRRRRSRVLL